MEQFAFPARKTVVSSSGNDEKEKYDDGILEKSRMRYLYLMRDFSCEFNVS